ncbi:polyprenol reductase 2-like isoform X2 [Durio zibethinus]|uniref:Polyprenol reductase 2-like isoform X2 n=1 Tax=Durio zibethinus TaxID=66656 RepID=A0A6P5YM64_DURZI|nr:polyprenol reductase 2-like isoform X2 [Durio zibethinus]
MPKYEKMFGISIEVFDLQSMNTIKTGLIWLLRVAWIAGTLPILIASFPSSRLNSFHALLQGFAKRGKIMPSSSHKFTVPQSFFLHFYLLAVAWTTMLLMGTWYFAYKVAPLSSESLSYSAAASHLTGGSHVFSSHKYRFTSAEDRFNVWKSVFLLLLMEVHVLRRLYETFHVFNYSSSARMHIFGYLTGVYFYIAAPLSLCASCVLEVVNFLADQIADFNVEGQEMLSTTDFDLWRYVKPMTRLGWCQWAGAAIFAWGWLHQYCCHAILGSLREHRDQTVEYVIPHGDWFEIVSSPHYLAEMVILFLSLSCKCLLICPNCCQSHEPYFLSSVQIIYAGLLVASGGADFTIWLLLVFVVANLAFAAAETHRWYLQKFEDYPLNRWAIFPFVY